MIIGSNPITNSITSNTVSSKATRLLKLATININRQSKLATNINGLCTLATNTDNVLK